jgi:hypothetical protein
MHELLEQSSEPSLLDKEVWLTVYENDHYPTVLNGLTQALSDQAKQRGGWNPMHLGVGYIDRFEQTVCGSTHPRWMAWLLVRYAELVTGHLLCLLASTRSLSPPDLFDPDRPACFGVLRTHAYRLAKELRQIPPSSLEEWACRIAESTYNQAGRLSRLNEDRNNIAHGRDCRSHHDIRRDVEAVIDSLREIVQDSKRLPRPEGLTPWTCVQAENQIGVLDRWRKDKKWRYLLPDQRRLIEVDVPQSSRSS